VSSRSGEACCELLSSAHLTFQIRHFPVIFNGPDTLECSVDHFPWRVSDTVPLNTRRMGVTVVPSRKQTGSVSSGTSSGKMRWTCSPSPFVATALMQLQLIQIFIRRKFGSDTETQQRKHKYKQDTIQNTTIKSPASQ